MAVTINASTTAGLVNSADTSGILQLQTANTAAVTIDASQNVGVGTSSPLSKLDVKFATNKHAIFTASSSYSNSADLVAVNDAGSEVALGLGGSAVQFYTGATERMRLDASGNLGVGTTDPSGYSFDTFSSFKLLSLRKTKKVNIEKIDSAANLSHCGPHIAHAVIPQTIPKAKNTINLPANTLSAILIIEVASMNIPL